MFGRCSKFGLGLSREEHRWVGGPVVCTPTCRSEERGSILPFASFYFLHCRYWACALAFSDVITQTHMDFDVQVDKLGCDSRLFNCFEHGPDSPLVGPSLGQLEPHGSRGFLPKGETACTLMENWWMTSRKNGKRTAGIPDGTCGQPQQGGHSPDPWWFSSIPSWGGTLSLRHIVPGGLALPRTGDSTAGGSTRRWSGTPNCVRATFQGKVASEPTVQSKNKKKKKENERKVALNLFQKFSGRSK